MADDEKPANHEEGSSPVEPAGCAGGANGDPKEESHDVATDGNFTAVDGSPADDTAAPLGEQPSEGELAARRAARFAGIDHSPRYWTDPEVERRRKLWLSQRQALCVYVCKEIMPEGTELVPGIESISQRFEALTKPLERKGWDALKLIDETPRLVSQLRAELPWCENARRRRRRALPVERRLHLHIQHHRI